ncbi:hypothetical protein SUDANB37_02297 [Streptomyces sp. enrichment culture]
MTSHVRGWSCVTLIAQLTDRADFARAKAELLGKLLRSLRGEGRDEDEYLRHGERIGPYLTCLRGLAFEEGHRDWCERTAQVLRERRKQQEQHEQREQYGHQEEREQRGHQERREHQRPEHRRQREEQERRGVHVRR